MTDRYTLKAKPRRQRQRSGLAPVVGPLVLEFPHTPRAERRRIARERARAQGKQAFLRVPAPSCEWRVLWHRTWKGHTIGRECLVTPGGRVMRVVD